MFNTTHIEAEKELIRLPNLLFDGDFEATAPNFMSTGEDSSIKIKAKRGTNIIQALHKSMNLFYMKSVATLVASVK